MFRFLFFILTLISVLILGVYLYVPYKVKQIAQNRINQIAVSKGIKIKNLNIKVNWDSIVLTDLDASGKHWKLKTAKIIVTSWKVFHFLPPEVTLGDIQVYNVDFKGSIPTFLKNEQKKQNRAIPPSGRILQWNKVTVNGLKIQVQTKSGVFTSQYGKAVIIKEEGGEILLKNNTVKFKNVPFYYVDYVDLLFDSSYKIQEIDLHKLVWKVNRDLKLDTKNLKLSPVDSERWAVKIQGNFIDNKGSVFLNGTINAKEKSGSIKVNFQKLQISSLLPRQLPLLNKNNIKSSGEVKLDFDKQKIKVDFSGSIKNLTIFHKRLSDKTIKNLNFTGNGKFIYFRQNRKLIMQYAKIIHKNLALFIKGILKKTKNKYVVDVSLKVPRVKCQNVLNAFPKNLIPHIKNFKFNGFFKSRIEVFIDFTHLRNKNGVKLSGKVDLSDCRVVKIPTEFRPSRFLNNFGYRIREQGGQISNIIVDEDSNWHAKIDEISPYMIRAVLTTEDGRFYRHHGFITREFTTALRKNLIAGKFKFGASSITMQVVKNVMLNRRKTISRKLEELVLSWFIEQHLSKKRIMEIYLNIIELGPGIYGVKHASLVFFGKDPSELTPKEAIYLASLLPSPKKRFKYYCRGEVSKYWNNHLNYLLKVMFKNKKLTKEEYIQAISEKIIFDHTDFKGKAHCFYIMRKYLGK